MRFSATGHLGHKLHKENDQNNLKPRIARMDGIRGSHPSRSAKAVKEGDFSYKQKSTPLVCNEVEAFFLLRKRERKRKKERAEEANI